MLNPSLNFVTIDNFLTETDVYLKKVDISYQIFGPPLGEAPVIMVNHALTGNSNVTGTKDSWFGNIIGQHQVIDTNVYTVIAFNVPGNGYDGQLLDDYKIWTAKDVAHLFLKALELLKVANLYALIGCSVGGGIAWEMVGLKPKLTKYFIPVAANWKASDWIKANCFLQEQITLNSSNGLADARMLAMLQYRTPASLIERFNNSLSCETQQPAVVDWLKHHGATLKQRFELSAYQLMNHVLSSINLENNNAQFSSVALKLQCEIIQISVNSDLFFTTAENQFTAELLSNLKVKNKHLVINSIHGHDAFLIENEQLINYLKPLF